MRVRRAVLWLARHPHVSVLGLLGVVAVLTLATVSAVGPLFTGAAPVHGERDTSAIVPVPTQRPPRHRVDAVHEALHAVGKLCKPAEVNRGRRPLTRAIETIRGFAAQYPRGGFFIDGEPGTTLGLVIVVRHQLETCDPTLARTIDELVPVQFRAK